MSIGTAVREWRTLLLAALAFAACLAIGDLLELDDDDPTTVDFDR